MPDRESRIVMSSPALEASRRYWDVTAETYDQIFPETVVGKAQRGAVWRELDRVFQSGQRVLELNCGTGIDAVHLAERGIRVLACDLSPRMVEVAVRRSVAANVTESAAFRVLPTEQIAQLVGEEPPFDGVLSNFSGLNCVEDLSTLSRSLGQLLRPGARAIFCMAAPICPWEMGWYLSHGDIRQALRRLRSGSDDPRVNVHYSSVRKIARLFSPEFRLQCWQGIGVAVPASCVEPLARRTPRLLEWLASIDRWLAHAPVVKGFADCLLLQFERSTI
jgi:SAM-dependent methyltransferase